MSEAIARVLLLLALQRAERRINCARFDRQLSHRIDALHVVLDALEALR